VFRRSGGSTAAFFLIFWALLFFLLSFYTPKSRVSFRLSFSARSIAKEGPDRPLHELPCSLRSWLRSVLSSNFDSFPDPLPLVARHLTRRSLFRPLSRSSFLSGQPPFPVPMVGILFKPIFWRSLFCHLRKRRFSDFHGSSCGILMALREESKAEASMTELADPRNPFSQPSRQSWCSTFFCIDHRRSACFWLRTQLSVSTLLGGDSLPRNY